MIHANEIRQQLRVHLHQAEQILDRRALTDRTAIDLTDAFHALAATGRASDFRRQLAVHQRSRTLPPSTLGDIIPLYLRIAQLHRILRRVEHQLIATP